MRKLFLLLVVTMMVTVGVSAQCVYSVDKNRVMTPLAPKKERISVPMDKKFLQPDALKKAPVTAKKGVRKSAAEKVAKTYIMDYSSWDYEANAIDFTESSEFTIVADSGVVALEFYKDEDNNPVEFKYNVKLVDFTSQGLTVYGYYDEKINTVFIPVQTAYTHDKYGRIVFSALVQAPDGSPLTYGYSMILMLDDETKTVSIYEGDFSEEIAAGKVDEGTYIGGFWNYMPDYLSENNSPYVWNRGYDAQIYVPNAFIKCNEVFPTQNGWGDWAWSDGYNAYVEDFESELVVHNFMGLCPVSILVEDGEYKLPLGQRVYDYVQEEPYGEYQIFGYNSADDELVNQGYITANVYIGDSLQSLYFYDIEYSDGSDGSEPGNNYVNDREKYFYIGTNADNDGARYWIGEYRYVDIYMSKDINLTGNDGSTVKVKLSNAGYATFFNAGKSFALPEGVTAKVVTGVSDGKLVYQALNNIPQGTAVVLNGAAGASVTLQETAAEAYTGKNLLVGSATTTTTFGSDKNGSYMFYKLSYGKKGTVNQNRLGWYWGAANGAAFQMAGGKAWLAVPTAAAARSFGIDDAVTAISSLNREPATVNHYYDLQGRQVYSLQNKGVYIINNKKVIIK